MHNPHAIRERVCVALDGHEREALLELVQRALQHEALLLRDVARALLVALGERRLGEARPQRLADELARLARALAVVGQLDGHPVEARRELLQRRAHAPAGQRTHSLRYWGVRWGARNAP